MIYVVAQSEPRLLLGFLFLVAVAIILNRYISRFTSIAKRKRLEFSRESDRHIVRMAMSKFEILQNDRIEPESYRLENYVTQMEIHSEPQERYARLSLAIPGAAIDFLRIGLYFIIGTGIFMKTHSVSSLV